MMPKKIVSKNNPKIFDRAKNCELTNLVTKPANNIAKNGFKINSSNFKLILILLVTICRSSKHEIIKLMNQPIMNASIPR